MSQTQTAAVLNPGTAPRHRGLRGNPALTLLAVALGVMMVGIDGTIVAVANPTCTRRWPASSGCPTPTCWPWRSA
jgi:hypothetical protein